MPGSGILRAVCRGSFPCRNRLNERLDCVCADLSAGAADDVIKAVCRPWKREVEISNARFGQAFTQASAVFGRDKFIASAMKEKRGGRGRSHEPDWRSRIVCRS